MRILLVAARYPWPPRRGDQIRAVQALSSLAPEHQVTLLAPEPPPGAPAPPSEPAFRFETYRPARLPAAGLARAALSGLPLQSGLFSSPDLRRKIRILAREADHGVLQLARLILHLEDFGAVPVVVDLIDSLSLNLARRAACDHPLLRPAWRLESRLLLRAERLLAERAERLLVVAERDRAWLAERLPAALAPRVEVVPLAVESRPESRAAAPTVDLALTGNLGYFVNADAAGWFLRDVWPGLSARRPGTTLALAGDRPDRALRAAAQAAGARLVPSPEDLRSWIAGAKLALAPMRAGSGVPVKILEAWGEGTPVVATPWAAAGTTGVPGEDFAVASGQTEWVETITALLDDPAARHRLAENGRRRLAAEHSPAVVRERWRGAVAR